jgi:hypothetical protein
VIPPTRRRSGRSSLPEAGSGRPLGSLLRCVNAVVGGGFCVYVQSQNDEERVGTGLVADFSLEVAPVASCGQ